MCPGRKSNFRTLALIVNALPIELPGPTEDDTIRSIGNSIIFKPKVFASTPGFLLSWKIFNSYDKVNKQ